jgi:hypothetical protein
MSILEATLSDMANKARKDRRYHASRKANRDLIDMIIQQKVHSSKTTARLKRQQVKRGRRECKLMKE